jgi:hypothetical protein
MSAVTDFTQICTILKGSTPTNEQIANVSDLFAEIKTGTAEERAASAIAGMRSRIKIMLREKAEEEVYGTAIKVAHLAANQPALLAAAEPDAIAAGNEAEASL